ncbi:hypothetical protein DU504_17895 [Haloplanus salinus]|uniref:Cell division protein A N-terminal domain-containing protein n=1 Tax=Haloplanus salinus TaxID=1126245 RepID=A0A368MZR7_9EURY|nr:hypothetical protein [Haloplanus salinus]RCU43757.1 hypothetical protein DU504_17895 [Haloplanus salinus]
MEDKQMTEYEDAGSTLDLMDFKNVRDGGVVETPTTYAMVMQIQPRDWLILSEERKESLYLSFLTFLRGVQFPTQILSMTTTYDPEPYLKQFEGAENMLINSGDDEEDVDPLDESPLLDYGRKYHTEWLRGVVDVAEIRDRDFYFAVAVAKDEEADDGLKAQIQSLMPSGNDVEVDDEVKYIEEVKARAQRVASKLPQTQVEAEILDTRPAVLEVLYEVYHGEKPPISFEQGSFSLPADKAQEVANAAYTPEEAAQAEANEDGDYESDRASDEHPEIEPEPDSEFDSDPLAAVGDGGYAHPDSVERVAESRILSWYARNIGPIGHGSLPVVPRAVYAGVFLGLLSLILSVGALGTFIWSMNIAERGTDIYWLARTVSFATAAASLPGFVLSLVVLFPSERRTKGLAVAGLAAAGYALTLFLGAYPQDWDSNPAVTTFTLEVYAMGIFALLIAVVLAVRSRQKVDLSNLVVASDPDASDVATDGGGADTPATPADASDDSDPEDPDADTDADTTDPGTTEDKTEVTR